MIMVNAATKKSSSRVLPLWVMRLIGITSLATAVISFALYWFKKNPPRRKINGSNGDEVNGTLQIIMKRDYSSFMTLNLKRVSMYLLQHSQQITGVISY